MSAWNLAWSLSKISRACEERPSVLSATAITRLRARVGTSGDPADEADEAEQEESQDLSHLGVPRPLAGHARTPRWPGTSPRCSMVPHVRRGSQVDGTHTGTALRAGSGRRSSQHQPDQPGERRDDQPERKVAGLKAKAGDQRQVSRQVGPRQHHRALLDGLGHGVEVAGADFALVLDRGEALLGGGELGLLQLDEGRHVVAGVAVGQVEHRVVQAVEAGQRDELELVAHRAQLALEASDRVLVELRLPVEAGRAALAALMESRNAEGKALVGVLTSITSKMRDIVKVIEPKVPEYVAQYQEKLTERLSEALAAQEQAKAGAELMERIRQEVVLYAVRIDVAEEFARLKTHLQAVDTALAGKGPVGKRLDFLMQELNREANTLSSKSVSEECTQAALELKLFIEQMREQVQNLE